MLFNLQPAAFCQSECENCLSFRTFKIFHSFSPCSYLYLGILLLILAHNVYTSINTFKSNYAFNVLSVSSSIYVCPLSFLLSKQFLYSLLNSIHAANTLMFVSIKFVVRSRFISFLEMKIHSTDFFFWIPFTMIMKISEDRNIYTILSLWKWYEDNFNLRVFYLDFEGLKFLFSSIFPFCGCPSYSSYEVFGLK